MLLEILIVNSYLETLIKSPGTAGSWSAETIWFSKNINGDILMYEGRTKRKGSMFLMASKYYYFFFLPCSVIQKRKLMQQYLICSLLIVSAMLRHPLNFEKLGNAGLESYFFFNVELWTLSLLKNASSQSQMKAKPCHGWERNGLLLLELTALAPCGNGQPDYL